MISPEQKTRYTNFVKQTALSLGFTQVGIAKAQFLEREATPLENWLKAQNHGEMHYMENHFDKRLDPRLLVPGAKSVVSLVYNYYPEKKQKQDTYKIAKYAYGRDYHLVVKDKVKQLLHLIQEEIGAVSGRAFTDSAPVLERVWAEKSGIGWRGKNSILIQKKHGSFFFLAELMIDLELDADPPYKTDHCGSCKRCIDACPTDAILPNATIDSKKCISYLTIELRDALPKEAQEKMSDWVFGCDICQDVCPWNRLSKPHNEPLFNPHEKLLDMCKKDWQQMSETAFQKIFKKSAVKRTKYKGLKRNINFVEGIE